MPSGLYSGFRANDSEFAPFASIETLACPSGRNTPMPSPFSSEHVGDCCSCHGAAEAGVEGTRIGIVADDKTMVIAGRALLIPEGEPEGLSFLSDILN